VALPLVRSSLDAVQQHYGIETPEMSYGASALHVANAALVGAVIYGTPGRGYTPNIETAVHGGFITLSANVLAHRAYDLWNSADDAPEIVATASQADATEHTEF
jgi:hypothetical protein